MDLSEGEADAEPTLYEVLYCAPDATYTQLRQAYKQQALFWHPDKNDDPEAEERFKRINTAWNVLSDDAQRAAYDRSMSDAPREHGHDEQWRRYADAEACRAAWQSFVQADEHGRRSGGASAACSAGARSERNVRASPACPGCLARRMAAR